MDSVNSAFANFQIDPGTLPNPGPTGSFQDMGGIKSMKVGPIKWSSKKNTTLDAANAAETFRAGRMDAGNVELILYYTPDDFDTLYDLALTRQNFNVQVLFPDGPDFDDPLTGGSTLAMEIHFEELPIDVPEDDEMMVHVKLKISGAPVFTPATS